MRNNYTKAEIDKLLGNMVIVVDTREKKNQHILEAWEQQGIKYIFKKLEQADYTAMIEYNTDTKDLGLTRDIYFDDIILIETKRNLDEIAQNLINKEGTFARERLERELMRINKIGARLLLYIENGNGLNDILASNYKSKYNAKAFLLSLLQFKARYGFHLVFIDPKLTGFMIHKELFCHVREAIKGGK